MSQYNHSYHFSFLQSRMGLVMALHKSCYNLVFFFKWHDHDILTLCLPYYILTVSSFDFLSADGDCRNTWKQVHKENSTQVQKVVPEAIANWSTDLDHLCMCPCSSHVGRALYHILHTGLGLYFFLSQQGWLELFNAHKNVPQKWIKNCISPSRR